MEPGALAERLDRLERSNRRLRHWLLALTLGFIASVVIGLGFMPIASVRNRLHRQMIVQSTFGESAVSPLAAPHARIAIADLMP